MSEPEVTPEMSAAAREFLVDEAHDERAAAKRAAALDGEATTPATPEEAKKQAQKEENEAKVRGALHVGGVVVWTLLDGVVVRFAGPELRLTPDEKATLAEATVPVIDKYLPDFLTKLMDGPEGALLMTAGAIYGAKAFTMVTAPTPPAQPPAAPPAPAPEVKS